MFEVVHWRRETYDNNEHAIGTSPYDPNDPTLSFSPLLSASALGRGPLLYIMPTLWHTCMPEH